MWMDDRKLNAWNKRQMLPYFLWIKFLTFLILEDGFIFLMAIHDIIRFGLFLKTNKRLLSLVIMVYFILRGCR